MKLIVSTLLLLWLMAPAAAAQTTRVDAIAEKQAEKAGALAPEGPSEAERIIKQVLLSPLLSGADGAYPWFGSVFGGSGMAAGAGYLKRLESAAYLNVQTGISINTSMVLRGTFAAPELRHGMMQAEVNAQWLSAKDVAYFGPGQQSSKDRRDSYDFTPIDIGGSASGGTETAAGSARGAGTAFVIEVDGARSAAVFGGRPRRTAGTVTPAATSA
jgi:hypothetical protein